MPVPDSNVPHSIYLNSALRFQSVFSIQNSLSDPYRLGCCLDKLVVADKLDRLLKAEEHGRCQKELFIRARRTDRGELLLLAGVESDILHLGALADDHTLIYGLTGNNEHSAAVLAVINAVGGGLVGLACNKRAGESHGDLALIGCVAVENGVENTLAVGVGHKLGSVTEEATGGDEVFKAHSRADLMHLKELALSLTELFDDCAHILLGHVNGKALYGLALLAVDLLEEYARSRTADLIALAAHCLEKDRKMHLASARNKEFLGRVAVAYAEGNVLEELAVESVADLTRGNKLTLAACEGRIVDREGHFDGGLANLNKLERLGIGEICDSITDIDVACTREANDVAHLCLLDGNTAESVDLEERCDTHSLRLLVRMVVADRNVLVEPQSTALDAADTDPSDVIVIVDGRNEELKGLVGISLGCGDVLKDGLKEGLEVGSLLVRVSRSSARSA